MSDIITVVGRVVPSGSGMAPSEDSLVWAAILGIIGGSVAGFNYGATGGAILGGIVGALAGPAALFLLCYALPIIFGGCFLAFLIYLGIQLTK